MKLTLVTTIGGETAIKEINKFSETFVRENNLKIKDGENPNSAITNLNKETVITTVADPATLKPLSVTSEELVEISTPTGAKKITEKHEYTFEWK